MSKSSQNQQGFTIIEILVFITVVAIIGTVVALNIRDYRAAQRDINFKRDINTIYYQLEAFYQKNQFYPSEISSEFKKSLKPEDLVDENNLEINQPGARYTYRPYGCADAKCKSFSLEAHLELESTYRKESLNR